MSEYFRIPKLGQHYTLRWAAEDMEYERAKSNGNNDTENTDRNNTSAANEGTISKVGAMHLSFRSTRSYINYINL